MACKFIKYRIEGIPSEVFFRQVILEKKIAYKEIDNFLILDHVQYYQPGISLDQFADLVNNIPERLAEYIEILLSFILDKNLYYLDIKAANIVVDVNDELLRWKPIDFECCYIPGKKCKLIMTNFQGFKKSKFIKNEKEAATIMIKALFDFIHTERLLNYTHMEPLMRCLTCNEQINREQCLTVLRQQVELLRSL